jgi:hypothetical protein
MPLPSIRRTSVVLLLLLVLLVVLPSENARKTLEGLAYDSALSTNRTSISDDSSSNVQNNQTSRDTTSWSSRNQTSAAAAVVETTTSWCVLDSGNMHKHYKHFPHTLQNLAPCWSYFRRQQLQSEQQNPNVACGILFNVSKQFNYKDIDIWGRHLIRSMRCRVVVAPNDIQNSGDNSTVPPSKDDAYYRMKSTSWFAKPQDAGVLREHVLARRKTKEPPPPVSFTATDSEYTTTNISRTRPLQIGIIQRYPSNKRCENVPLPKGCSHYREIINLDQMTTSLQDAFPSADIHLTKLKGKDLTEQAWWWYNQDIIVAAHGATLANVIFLQPGSAVIEIFPTDYAPFMFQSLMKNVGVYPYRIDKASSSKQQQAQSKKVHPRDAALEPNITLVVELVQQAVLRRDQSETTNNNAPTNS